MGKKSSDKPTKPKGKIDEQKEKANSNTKNAPETQGKQYVCIRDKNNRDCVSAISVFCC